MPKDRDFPAFLFYPDDFTSDGKVEAMTTEEVGAYMLLLCKAWRERPVGSVPADDAVLARWTRLTPARWAECSSRVLAPFTLGTDNRWHQRRMRSDHKKMMVKRKKRVAGAIAGALGRWGSNPPDPPGKDANRMRTASHSTIGDGNGTRPSSSPPEGECEGKPKSRFLPSTEREAVEWAGMVGVPPEFASQCYHQLEARNWVDGSGQGISKWTSYVKSRYERQRHTWNPGSSAAPERPLTPNDIRTIIAAKEAVANELRAKHSSEVAMGTNWNNQAKRKEWQAIRSEIKQLQIKLSKMA